MAPPTTTAATPMAIAHPNSAPSGWLKGRKVGTASENVPCPVQASRPADQRQETIRGRGDRHAQYGGEGQQPQVVPAAQQGPRIRRCRHGKPPIPRAHVAARNQARSASMTIKPVIRWDAPPSGFDTLTPRFVPPSSRPRIFLLLRAPVAGRKPSVACCY